MRPRPRLRKMAKWGGLAANVVLAAAWLGSAWRFVGWSCAGPLGLNIGAGRLHLVFLSPGMTKFKLDTNQIGWSSGLYNPATLDLWFEVVTGSTRVIRIPLWVPLVPGIGVTVLAWRWDVDRKRRGRATACPTCGYSRAGLPPGAMCPECGA